MPSTADIHIQNIDPAPPEYIAVATPTMLPVPRQAASAEKAPSLALAVANPRRVRAFRGHCAAEPRFDPSYLKNPDLIER